MLRLSFITAVFAASVVALSTALSGCGQFSPAYMKPLSAQTRAQLAEKGLTEEQPILIRIFKAESELEVWKQKDDGRYYHFKTYPICAYSGGLGPKLTQPASASAGSSAARDRVRTFMISSLNAGAYSLAGGRRRARRRHRPS